MPFGFSMFFFRNCYKKDKKTGIVNIDIPDEIICQFIERMFGQKFLKVLEDQYENSIDYVLEILVLRVLEIWGYGIEPSKDNKEKKI